ncbi:TlpA disulfide reductase family protein [Megalodesulfovibrio paquesii]
MRATVVHLTALLALCAVLSGMPGKAEAQQAVLPIDHISLMQQVRENKGKVVVVNFFATWCGPCQLEIPGLKKLRTEYDPEEVLFLGVSVDEDPAALPSFVKRMDFNYPVYLAKPGVAQFYDVGGIPKMLVYNRNGELTMNHVGFLDASELKQELSTLLAQ